MKDWVKPFLAEQYRRILVEAGRDDKGVEEALRLKSRNYENPFDLTLYVQTDFGIDLGGDASCFTEVFAFVLGDLPKEAFDRIRSADAFYIFTPNPGAEVKVFAIREPLGEGHTIRIVNFPYSLLLDRSAMALQGTIAHELAHVYLEHNLSPDRAPEVREDEADQLAISWGFREGIETLRREQEAEQQTWKCPKCKVDYHGKVRFCMDCGQELEATQQGQDSLQTPGDP